jgi:hypothetical protein
MVPRNGRPRRGCLRAWRVPAEEERRGSVEIRQASAAANEDGAKTEPEREPPIKSPSEPEPKPPTEPAGSTRTLHLGGAIPPELWNRLGTKIIPKLRSGADLRLGLDFSVTVPVEAANELANELRQILQELGLAQAVKVN